MANPHPYYEILDAGNPAPEFKADAAFDFLAKHPDPVCSVRLSHWNGDINDEQFWQVLEKYQAPNGGFKGGIDPDYTGEIGSIHSTIEAMRILVAHHQLEMPQVTRMANFIRQMSQPDGTWEELPEVLATPKCPKWYAPAKFRIYETACIAGYGLELGLSDVWPQAVRYVRQMYPQIPLDETPHPYWAILLLLGRSTASADRSIALDAFDNLGMFVRRHKIDPYDCSAVIEILDGLDYPEVDEMLMRIYDMVRAAQNPDDGGIMTAYGEKLRPAATFNALMALALMVQRGLITM